MTTTILRRPERVVFGIDGSVASHAAVRWAITHARSGDTVTLAPAWSSSRSPMRLIRGVRYVNDAY